MAKRIIRSPRLKAWQRQFAELVRLCWKLVREKGIPKGQRQAAFRKCMENKGRL